MAPVIRILGLVATNISLIKGIVGAAASISAIEGRTINGGHFLGFHAVVSVRLGVRRSNMLVQSKTLIDAAKRNGVKHIVHLGAFTREHDTYTTVFAWHQMIEAYLRVSGIAWTNLHPNMFMQNLLAGWRVKGGLYSVYTSKPIGFTALEDVTEAAAVILMEGPEKHSGKDYWFSADILDPQQVAETLTAATGHKFTAAVRDHERFLKEMALPPGSTFDQPMQREESSCSARSSTEEWRTSEA